MKSKINNFSLDSDGFNPESFFPYIEHTLNHEFLESGSLGFMKNGRTIKEFYLGNSLDNIIYRDDAIDKKVYDGGTSTLFSTISTRGISQYQELVKNPKNVILIAARHRSLMDFIIEQPIHYSLIKKDLMILSGDNLFLGPFDKILRDFGAFMFLRGDKNLKRKGYENAFLSAKDYLIVLSAYLKQQMIDGVVDDLGITNRFDEIVFPEIHEDISNGVLSGGRTKSGNLGNISPIPFIPIHRALRGSDVNVYVAPVDISFSKYPDAHFITSKKSCLSSLVAPARYLFELNYVFNRYPHFSEKHHDAKLDVKITYSSPLELSSFSGRDIIKFKDNPNSLSEKIRQGISNSETIYPAAVLFRAMDGASEKSFRSLDDDVRVLVDNYAEKGIDVSNVVDKNGNNLSSEELYNISVDRINANPMLLFHLPNKSNKIISSTSNKIIVHNKSIGDWYGNQLRHLD